MGCKESKSSAGGTKALEERVVFDARELPPITRAQVERMFRAVNSSLITNERRLRSLSVISSSMEARRRRFRFPVSEVLSEKIDADAVGPTSPYQLFSIHPVLCNIQNVTWNPVYIIHWLKEMYADVNSQIGLVGTVVESWLLSFGPEHPVLDKLVKRYGEDLIRAYAALITIYTLDAKVSRDVNALLSNEAAWTGVGYTGRPRLASVTSPGVRGAGDAVVEPTASQALAEATTTASSSPSSASVRRHYCKYNEWDAGNVVLGGYAVALIFALQLFGGRGMLQRGHSVVSYGLCESSRCGVDVFEGSFMTSTSNAKRMSITDSDPFHCVAASATTANSTAATPPVATTDAAVSWSPYVLSRCRSFCSTSRHAEFLRSSTCLCEGESVLLKVSACEGRTKEEEAAPLFRLACPDGQQSIAAVVDEASSDCIACFSVDISPLSAHPDEGEVLRLPGVYFAAEALPMQVMKESITQLDDLHHPHNAIKKKVKLIHPCMGPFAQSFEMATQRLVHFHHPEIESSGGCVSYLDAVYASLCFPDIDDVMNNTLPEEFSERLQKRLRRWHVA